MESDVQVRESAESNEPFEPQAADLGGCGKPAVFGCLALLGLLAIGLFVVMFKARDMLGWALAEYEESIVEALSEEVTAEERERLAVAFARARAAIDENRIDPAAMQKLQRFMTSPPDVNQPIDAETVRELIEVLEQVGKPAVGPPEEELQPPAAEPGASSRHRPATAHVAV